MENNVAIRPPAQQHRNRSYRSKHEFVLHIKYHVRDARWPYCIVLMQVANS